MKSKTLVQVLILIFTLGINTSFSMEQSFVHIPRLPMQNLSPNFASLFPLLGAHADKRNHEELEIDLILGAATNYALLNNDQSFIKAISTQEIQPHAVRGLIWFYYLLGTKKKQNFKEGTLTIVNPNSKSIIDFLNSYPHKGLIEFMQVKFPAWRSSPESYERISSHFKMFMKVTGIKLPHYGLDITGLPEGKQTLLYGQVDRQKNLIFIKPENFGTLDVASLGHHGFEWIVSLAVKSPLKDYFGDWLPSDDDPRNRKERIPSALIKSYVDFIKEVAKTKLLRDVEELEKDAAVYGIQRMYSDVEFLVKMLEDQGADTKKYKSLAAQGQNLLQIMNAYDHLDYRFGREVILTQQEFAIVTPADYQKLKDYALKVIIPGLRGI